MILTGARAGAVFILSVAVAGCSAINIASPSPSPTASPTPSPSPAPTQSPSPSPSQVGDQVIALFVTDFAAAQPPFHVETEVLGTGTVGTEGGDFSLSVGGDVSGEDFAGEVTIPGRGSTEVILVDGVAYGRPAGGDWVVNEGFVQTQPLNPFGLLDPNDLEYVGVAERGDRQLHELRTTEWIGGPLEAPGITDIELISNEFNIYVGDDGIPVEADLFFTITGQTGGLDAMFAYDVLYTFTNVGDPVTIEPPALD